MMKLTTSTNIQTAQRPKSSKIENGNGVKAESKRRRPSVSPDEIREKLAQHKEVKSKQIAKITRDSKSDPGFLNQAPEPSKLEQEMAYNLQLRNSIPPVLNQEMQEVELPVARPSDVGLNDPNDPATVGKLKSILSSGAFSFNPKEREALAKILGDQ